MSSFLRRIYDSESCNYRCKQIFLSNNSIKLLHYVQYLLKKHFDIIATGPYLVTRARMIMKRNGKVYRRNNDNHQIVISRKLHIQRFLSEVGFSIQKKQYGLPRRK